MTARHLRSRCLDEGLTVCGWKSEMGCQQLGQVLRRSELPGLEFLDRLNRAADPFGELFLREVARSTAVLKQAPEREWVIHRDLRWAKKIYPFLSPILY